MLLAKSASRRPQPLAERAAAALKDVSSERLRAYVDMLSFPRHYLAEGAANRRARDLLLKRLRGFGYAPRLQGRFDNIVAFADKPAAGPQLLLGAHYDSVPGSPGADDNASAVAACLEVAALAKRHGFGSTMVVLFNREEDGLLGSRDFVESLSAESGWSVAEAHVFEMVGYCVRTPDSQRLPPGLPVAFVPRTGDFLALLANRRSNAIAEELLCLAAGCAPELSALALKSYFGIERRLEHLNRSDHAPFWDAGIPAIMWTDTSEFRNPHYHRASDVPETLDFDFLSGVAKLALARAATWFRERG